MTPIPDRFPMLPTSIALPGGQGGTAASVRSVGPLLKGKTLPAWLVCLWLLAGIRCLQAQSDNQENSPQPAAKSAKEVLRGVRDSFARIKSIHYTFESTSLSTHPRMPTSTVKTDAEFALDNGKFYSSFNGSTTRDNGSKWFDSTAFDGSKYQRYDGRLLIVTSQTTKHPYVALQPVMYPFLFAWTDTRSLTFEEMVNQECWEELGNRAKVEPSETVNGHPCDVVSFIKQSGTSPPFDVAWKVYAARDLGSYPVRETTTNGKIHSVLDVIEWKVVPSAMGDVVIPIKIVGESRDQEGGLVQSKSFAVSLLSVNGEVADRLFSLKRFNPEKVRHLD